MAETAWQGGDEIGRAGGAKSCSLRTSCRDHTTTLWAIETFGIGLGGGGFVSVSPGSR